MEPHVWKRTGARRVAITGVLLVAGALAFTSGARADHDDDRDSDNGFTKADFQGRYVASFKGVIDGTKVAAEGFLIANGCGHITAKRTVSAGGIIFQDQTFTCTYTVASDGTGTAHCTISDGSKESYDFTLGEEGAEVRFIRVPEPGATMPLAVVLGQASRK